MPALKIILSLALMMCAVMILQTRLRDRISPYLVATISWGFLLIVFLFSSTYALSKPDSDDWGKGSTIVSIICGMLLATWAINMAAGLIIIHSNKQRSK
jgi:hypothetical protein